VANTFQGQPIGSFAYANDALARRVSRMDQSAISAQSVATNLFAYNARSELSSARMGTNAYGYVYDPIGNRLAAFNNAEALAYAANVLNQYTAIASSQSVPSIPLFDADGNLTNYNGWTFTWDAENRLITAVQGSTVVSNQYDFMSRRVAKSVGGTTHHFLYNGWAMIQEEIGTQTNSYVYGLDLSGSMQGVGTIGGILCASLNGTQAFYFFDANGNVSDLAGASGNCFAHYEFDPFGNTIVASGTQAAANPFRFSTKHTEEETGLVYYGYRYYSPGVGRWANRDPIEEEGGCNIYLFSYNRSLNCIDPLGMTPTLSWSQTTAPTEIQDCGYPGFNEWKISWLLQDGSSAWAPPVPQVTPSSGAHTGYIMQKMRIKVVVKGVADNDVAPYPKDYYYWEAWSVTSDGSSATISDRNIDQWKYTLSQWQNDKNKDCYKGSISATGEAAYYGGVTVAQLNTAGWKKGVDWRSDEVQAGGLISMKGADHR
jgi:RHS repeat-associated protein